MSWLGLDIGGANLKAADGRGWGRSVPFALWRQPERLSAALAALVEKAPAADRIAVTMTGELCDCFKSKAEGVRHILSAIQHVAGPRNARVYLLNGKFATIEEAKEKPHFAAASNWHALAAFACRFVTGRAGLLIDIGSTTTDVIPLIEGQVTARGRTDTERLQAGELLYRGVGRTPICAVAKELPWQGKPCPIAAEFFSTTADAYVLLGDIIEEPDADWTADGRPLTIAHAQQRLARQLCADAGELMPDEFQLIARAVREMQLCELRECVERVVGRMAERPSTFIISGSGELLAREAFERSRGECQVIGLAEKMGVQANKTAPAHAIAVLATEFFGLR
jgi:(4-(4-[2-(gamma-L-glutamylamino)ethyl]phenoxymethyl)furan-2-yl)methanamine synthase